MGRKGNTHGELRLRVKLVQVGATPLWTTLTQPCLQRHRLPAGRIAPHGVHLLSNAPKSDGEGDACAERGAGERRCDASE
jgi:hypothetical protein